MGAPLPMFVALLRGINVSGHNKIPMTELRSVCVELGWGDVQTYIQSGNVVFRADAPTPILEGALEQAVERRFGLSVPVVVRAGAEWASYTRNNPFREASEREPSLVMLALAKAAPRDDTVQRLQERATNGETVAQVGDALWIHYAGGAGRSKLSPALLDRTVGSPVTTRNWRTVLNLEKLILPPPGRVECRARPGDEIS